MEAAAIGATQIGIAELSSCLGLCTATSSSRLSPLECGLQCSRSLDVHARGLPIYVPFSSRREPAQYVGSAITCPTCSAPEVSAFYPDPAAPTLFEFSERNP